MNTLVLLRHGESQWNLENRFTGFRDVELSPAGEKEADAAGQRLKTLGIKFDAVFTSTQKRAINTAQRALAAAGQSDLFAKVIKHDDLRERDYGDLTGQNKDEGAGAVRRGSGRDLAPLLRCAAAGRRNA